MLFCYYKSKYSQQGFSLIELMVVISIITLVVSLSIPKFLSFQIKAARAEVRLLGNNIATLAQAYHAEEGVYPPMGAYGYGNSGATILNYCDKDVYALSLTATMGFISSSECNKLKYFYNFYNSATYGHPAAPSTDSSKYFTIVGSSIAYGFSGGFTIKRGNTPFSPGLCKSVTGYQHYYHDAWVLTENNEFFPQGNVSTNDALKMCL